MLPTPPELAAALADRYTLLSVLGAGGTSTVYRAKDEKHGRDVAIKVLRPELAASLTRQRFTRETSIVAKLQHPHILSLIDSGSAADTYYFVMPLVDGETLRERLDRDSAPTVGEITRILADLADALAYAHERGVVHRDIKPSNVLLTGRHALLMDFGVAKGLLDDQESPLTVGIALGTPTYMSPEQAMALPTVDHRADLYALGVLGYELLSGNAPFAGGSPHDILAAHVSQTPADLSALRPDVPETLRAIVMRCLEKEPNARWPDAKTIVGELDALITPTGGSPPTSGLPAQGSRPLWKRPTIALFAATLALAVAAVFGLRNERPDPITTDREQITFEGNVIESTISADGQWLAYVTSDGLEQALFVRDLQSATALELDRGDEVAGLVWSTDGSEIAYHAGRVDPIVRALSRLGGASRVLGRGHALPSPDFSRLARASQEADSITIVDRLESDTTRIPRPAWVRWTNQLAWSADSKRLAIEVENPAEADHAILIALVEGTLVEAVRDSAKVSDPSFSRNGRFLYYLRQPLGELPDLHRIEIASDGRPRGEPELVFRAFDGDARPEFYMSYFSNRLTHADDGGIVYVRTNGESNVWVFDVSAAPESERPHQITTGSAFYTNVRVSPDGEQLALVRVTRIETMIGVMPSAGGPLEPIMATWVWGEPSWSASGDRLAMAWNESRGDIQVSVRDFGAGTTRLVSGSNVGADLTWAGTQLVAQGPGNKRLMLIDPELGDDQTVLPDTLGFNFRPRGSPDGRRVAYRKNWKQRSLWVQGLNTDEAARELLAEDVYPLRFDETGELLYVTDTGVLDNSPRRVLRLSLATGELRTIMTLPAEFVAEDISPDGRWVFATQIEWRGDVWRLSLSDN